MFDSTLVCVGAFAKAAPAVLRAAAHARFPERGVCRRAETAALVSLAARLAADEEARVGLRAVDQIGAFGRHTTASRPQAWVVRRRGSGWKVTVGPE